MRNFLARLFGGPSQSALAHAHRQAEIARLAAIAKEAPPPGEGWRVGDQDSEGKWTVWNGPRKIASFWDENEAAEWARAQNRDPGPPNPVHWEDGKYCVNCGSHETDDSLKARGYVSCCPERYVIPEVWHVTDKLATGQYHLWRPLDGLETITDDSWADKADARHEADHRNLLAHRPHPAALKEDLGDGVWRDVAPEEAQAAAKAALRPLMGPASEGRALRRADFLNVPIPDGVRMVVGPLKSPDDGNWWTFDRNGPVRGYTRKTNAQAAADRANNGPAS